MEACYLTDWTILPALWVGRASQPHFGYDGGVKRRSDHCRFIILAVHKPLHPMKTLLLYIATAIAEIVGCYLPYLWLKEGKSAVLLIPAALSLAIFAWLLTLHPSAAGRVYAAYGGVYIAVALIWLWAVEGMRPTGWDWAGVSFSLIGMAIIAFQPR